MTPVEQHNANIAAIKIAIENALEVTKVAEKFAAGYLLPVGIRATSHEPVAEARTLLEEVLELVQEAEVPVYDKAKEEELYRRISFFPAGTDLRYEEAKQLVAYMAGRPKK